MTVNGWYYLPKARLFRLFSTQLAPLAMVEEKPPSASPCQFVRQENVGDRRIYAANILSVAHLLTIFTTKNGRTPRQRSVFYSHSILNTPTFHTASRLDHTGISGEYTVCAANVCRQTEASLGHYNGKSTIMYSIANIVLVHHEWYGKV